MFLATRNVSIGTAATVEHLKSGAKFRVEGDGRFENNVQDKFTSTPGALHGIEDKPLQAFLKMEKSLRESGPLDEDKAKEVVQSAAKGTLGEGWIVKNAYTNGRGEIVRSQIELRSDGGAAQEINTEYREREPEVTLGASFNQDGWLIKQDITGTLFSGDSSVIAQSINESGSIEQR